MGRSGAVRRRPRSICRPASSRSSSSTRALHIRSIVPAPDPARRKRELDRWRSYVRGLEWKSLQPWTPSHPGNFRHLHQLFEGKSMLIAYVSKKTDTGRAYYVAAKLDLGLIAQGLDSRRDRRRLARAPAGGDPGRGRAPDLRHAAAGDAVPVRIVVREDAVRVARADHAQRRRRAAQAGRHRAVAGPAAGAGVAGHLRGRPGRAVAVGARRTPRRRSCAATSSPTCRTS